MRAQAARLEALKRRAGSADAQRHAAPYEHRRPVLAALAALSRDEPPRAGTHSAPPRRPGEREAPARAHAGEAEDERVLIRPQREADAATTELDHRPAAAAH